MRLPSARGRDYCREVHENLRSWNWGKCRTYPYRIIESERYDERYFGTARYLKCRSLESGQWFRFILLYCKTASLQNFIRMFVSKLG